MYHYRKHPDEEITLAGSILYVQQDTETISLSDSSVAATDKDGTVVTSTILDVSTLKVTDDPEDEKINNALSVLVKGGSKSSGPYKIKFTMHTNVDHIWIVEVLLFVTKNGEE